MIVINLDPDSSSPLYRQLTQKIVQKIESKVYKLGDKIPSIRKLANQYQISNITVIRALEELRQHQYIYSVPGKGYFVSHHHIIQKYMPSQDGFSDMAEKEGAIPSSTVLRKEIQPSTNQQGNLFGVDTDSEIVILERIRRIDGFPLCTQISYLPHELCHGIVNYDFSQYSLYHILREIYHLTMAKSKYTIQACLAESRTLEHLHLEAPAAVLCIQHWAFAPSGRLFEYGESVYRGDCFQINSPINEYEIISEISGKNEGSFK